MKKETETTPFTTETTQQKQHTQHRIFITCQPLPFRTSAVCIALRTAILHRCSHLAFSPPSCIGVRTLTMVAALPLNSEGEHHNAGTKVLNQYGQDSMACVVLDNAYALLVSPDGCPRQQLRMSVTTIGPLIASYLAARPSELKQCNPCPGPRTERWRLKSTLFPIERAFRCICNGRGYCIHSLDTRPSLTLRCTCIHDCHTHPAAEWKAQAWKVVYVLMLGKPMRRGPNTEDAETPWRRMRRTKRIAEGGHRTC